MICLFLKMTLLKKLNYNQNEVDLNYAEITLIELHFVVLYCGTCLSNCHLALIIWACRRMYMLLILLFNLRHSVWLINLNICMCIYIFILILCCPLPLVSRCARAPIFIFCLCFIFIYSKHVAQGPYQYFVLYFRTFDGKNFSLPLILLSVCRFVYTFGLIWKCWSRCRSHHFYTKTFIFWWLWWRW